MGAPWPPVIKHRRSNNSAPRALPPCFSWCWLQPLHRAQLSALTAGWAPGRGARAPKLMFPGWEEVWTVMAESRHPEAPSSPVQTSQPDRQPALPRKQFLLLLLHSASSPVRLELTRFLQLRLSATV